MKIALLGGSFNPIHKGHIMLADEVIKQLGIHRVIIMPTNLSPHKDNKTLLSPKHRYNMCKLACCNHPRLEVSDLEIKRSGKSYTYETLNSLKELYPRDELFIIVGADMFMTLESWKHPREILSTASVIAVPRNSRDYKTLSSHSERLKKYNAETFILKNPVMQVSSTQIRKRLSLGLDVSGLLDARVLEYIYYNHLYGKCWRGQKLLSANNKIKNGKKALRTQRKRLRFGC